VLGQIRAAFRRALIAADAFQQRHVWLSFPFAVVRKMSNDGGGALAGLIAYYGFLGVFPLLLVFAAVLGFVLGGDPALRDQVLNAAESSFPALKGYVSQRVSGSDTALGVGLVGALWAGLGVTRATERAMNAIWDIPLADRPNLWWSRVRGLAMLCILGSTFLVSTGLTSLRGAGGALALPTDALAVGGSLALNVALYLLAFQVLTNRHLAWRTVLPGALVGGAGWTILQNLGAYYVRHEVAHASQLYGSLAVVVGLLAWIYLGAQLTLYAAEVNVVLADRLWPRSLSRALSTDADHRALTRQAREAERTAGEVITVRFGSIATEAGARPAPSAPAGGRTRPPEVPGFPPEGLAAPGGRLSPHALATHASVALLAAHLDKFDRCRQQADICEDPAARAGLLRRLRAEAGDVAAVLGDLARNEADLGEALRRHLS
jgi:YihY family inner membrane protein